MAEWEKVPDEITDELLALTTNGKQVLAFDRGSYFNAWLVYDEHEGGWYWMDDADSEPQPSYFMPLPATPKQD